MRVRPFVVFTPYNHADPMSVLRIPSSQEQQIAPAGLSFLSSGAEYFTQPTFAQKRLRIRGSFPLKEAIYIIGTEHELFMTRTNVMIPLYHWSPSTTPSTCPSPWWSATLIQQWRQILRQPCKSNPKVHIASSRRQLCQAHGVRPSETTQG